MRWWNGELRTKECGQVTYCDDIFTFHKECLRFGSILTELNIYYLGLDIVYLRNNAQIGH